MIMKLVNIPSKIWNVPEELGQCCLQVQSASRLVLMRKSESPFHHLRRKEHHLSFHNFATLTQLTEYSRRT